MADEQIGLPERGDVAANVSQHSRFVGRVPIHRQVEGLEAEKKSLCLRKKELEQQISELASWKKRETAKLLDRNLPKTQAIHATVRLESEFTEKRSPILAEVRIIQQRLDSIGAILVSAKREISSRPSAPREDVEILRRIEKLLIILVERSNQKTDFTGSEL